MKPGRGNRSSPIRGGGHSKPLRSGEGPGWGLHTSKPAQPTVPAPPPRPPAGAGGSPADQTRLTSPSSLSLPVSRVRILQKFATPDAAKPRWRRGFGEQMDGAGEREARRGRGTAWAECGRSGACRKMGLQSIWPSGTLTKLAISAA